MGFFEKLKQGLKKTTEGIFGQIDSFFKSFTKIDEDLFEELEELLIAADCGASTSEAICKELRGKVKKTGTTDPADVKKLLVETVTEMMEGDISLDFSNKPAVILVIGVNGVGKTTTIGKLCARFKEDGKKVIIAAADTFRAAAIEQMEIWAKRAECEIVKHSEGADPAAVVFDAIAAAKARSADVVICDTAGRLHNKKHLMEELSKINRIIERELPDSPRETLLVLDATTGQNAVNQAREFKNAAGITGIVLTKLDGTARGGVVISIKQELSVPVKYIGVGEQLDDLQPFNPHEFAKALFNSEE
ncbi:MAG: signal recognition particle-docking protein FtsY [Oscillospiraceae bacterium]|jgi:fused signal recognition particle receptor|nr:signal recognition particle-docking protein FtsY [Oscillospiraceae bacterium]